MCAGVDRRNDTDDSGKVTKPLLAVFVTFLFCTAAVVSNCSFFIIDVDILFMFNYLKYLFKYIIL
jgi:hypothetical protein